VTAHPLALIAGKSDGIDVEQREQIDRHIASCDTCRTHARAIERTDRLIASPEPSLALPPRAVSENPRGRTTTVMATVAAGLLLVVAASVLRQSLQPAVAHPAWADMVAIGNDACDLAPASRVVRVAEPPRSAFPRVPPLSTSGPFQGECAYGYHDGSFDYDLLVRTEQTPVGEASVQWRMFAGSQDPPLPLSVAERTTSPGGVTAVRWSATVLTAGRQWSVIGVAAESYFFVVTAETNTAARQFADAVLDQLKQRRLPADAWRSSACMVMDRAAAQAGLVTASGAQPIELFGHYGSNSSVFGSNICAYGEDDWWDDPHLFLRAGRVVPEDVQQLLADSFTLIGGPPEFRMDHLDDWTLTNDGMWLSHAQSPNQRRWTAVAGVSGSLFFMVTSDTDDKAIRLARAVAEELKR
jgi:hypothetical protein